MKEVTTCHNRQEKIPILHGNHRKIRYSARKQYPIRAQPDSRPAGRCHAQAVQTTSTRQTPFPPTDGAVRTTEAFSKPPHTVDNTPTGQTTSTRQTPFPPTDGTVQATEAFSKPPHTPTGQTTSTRQTPFPPTDGAVRATEVFSKPPHTVDNAPTGQDKTMHMVCEGSGQVAWQTTEPDKTVLPPPPADCQTMTAYLGLRKATAFRLLDRLLLAMYDEERLRNASLSQLTGTFHEVIRTFSTPETSESKQNGMLEKLLAELKEIE